MKKVLITVGTGFLGRRLVEKLIERGDRVTVLTRDAAAARRHFPDRVRLASWTPEKEGPWTEEVGIVDAIVNLAGEPVAQGWGPQAKDAIVRSRVDATHLIVDAIGKAKQKPTVLVNASAIGYYGPRPAEEKLDEDSEPGEGFLADVVQRWEEAARGAEAHGLRVAMVRIGVVLGEGGGALEKMAIPFKLYAGGPIGDGTQVISWVHREDAVGILLLALDDDRVKGPINAVSPYPASNEELAKTMGTVMNRPSWLRVPAPAIRAAMGEAAEMLLTGQSVFPKRAAELGYEFQHARLLPALESILGDK